MLPISICIIAKNEEKTASQYTNYIYNFQLGQSFNTIHDAEKACYYYGKGLEFEVNS